MKIVYSDLCEKDFSDVTPTASTVGSKPLASLDTWLELEGKNPVSVGVKDVFFLRPCNFCSGAQRIAP